MLRQLHDPLGYFRDKTRVKTERMDLHFANAPISWGINEFGIESSMKPDQMLDELKLAGYSGTELGDYGFFPTTDAELEQMIKYLT